MELRPHLLLEATLIAMRFAEADEGYVYLREEYATARARLERALERVRAQRGLLDGLTLELVIGAGAYIAGEETAMLESMEGRRAMPRLQPPFPAQVGYLGRPTLINNVETLAHIPAILRHGGEWWAGLGTRGASGTRLWSVSGAVGGPAATRRRTGSRRASSSTSTRAASPARSAPSCRAAPRAGSSRPRRSTPRSPATGCAEYGAGVGSAAVQVFPATYSPLRLLAETMRFFAEESCQKCTPVPDRQPRPPPPLRAARARRGDDDAREARRVAARDGEDVDLRPRPGVPDPGAERDALWPELFAPLGAQFDTGRAIESTAMVEFTLDGRTVTRARGRAPRPRGRAPRHVRPHALPRRQARPLRRLPDVRRGRRGRAAADAGLRDPRRRGDGRLDERRDHGLPEDADRDAPLRAPERRRPAAGRTSSSTSRTSSAPRRRSSSPTRSARSTTTATG